MRRSLSASACRRAQASASSASRRFLRHSRDASLWHSAHQELRPSRQRGLERNSEQSFSFPHFRQLLVIQAFSRYPSRKTGMGRPGSPSKKRPSISASFQVRVPVAPSTQRREVRALIRSTILRSDDVVTDEALGLTALRAAMAVSLLHPRCLLLPPALVQRRTGRARSADAGMQRTGGRPSAPAEASRHVSSFREVWASTDAGASVVGAPLEEGVVVGDANQRPRVARQDDN